MKMLKNEEVGLGVHVPGSSFWSINWENTGLTCGENEPFFSEEDYERLSVTHKKFLLSLYGCSYNEIIKEITETSSKTGEPRKQKTQEAKERFSSLTPAEQQLYLQLLQKYSERICSNPSDEEKKNIKKLGELHVKVVREQGELIQHLKENSRKLNYNHIHPEARRYVQKLLEKKLDQSLSYPRHYNLDKGIPFASSDDAQDDDDDISFAFQKTILELGRVPRMVTPSLQKPCILPLDYEKISKRFPLTVVGGNLHTSKNPVSQDSIAKTLAEKYHADFVLSSSSLKTLLDNIPLEYDKEWELPAVIEEIQDSIGCRKTVYLDKVLPKSKLTGRERSSLYHKYAVKVQCSHFNPVRAKPLRPGDSNEKAGMPKHLENRTLSAVDTDLFGDCNDLMELETFGASTNSATFQCNKSGGFESFVVADEKPKNIELESPASPDPEDNTEFASTPMKVVNVNSSFDTSSDADCLNVFQKPLIPLKKQKLDITPTCKSNDSDSDTLIIDLDDMLTSTTKSSLKEDMEKVDTEIESSLRRSTRNRNLQPKVLPESLPITSPKRTVKSKGAETGTRMVLRSKKKKVEICQGNNETAEALDDDDDDDDAVVPKVETSENDNLTVDHEEKLQVDESSVLPHETLVNEKDTSCRKEKEEELPVDDDMSRPSSFNIGTSIANPLESILQLQKELLKTEINAEDVSSKLTDCQTEKTSNYPTPDPMDNVVYSLCTLGKWNLLIRQQVNALQLPNGIPCFLYPKLEYQSDYGGELNSKSELIRQWASLLVQRSSQVLKVRLNAYTSSILMCENVNLKTIIEKNKTRFQPEILVKQLASVLKSLHRLSSGNYILLHKKSEPKIDVYKTTDNNKRGSFDLHILLQQRQMEVNDGLQTCSNSSSWLPIDTEILLPSLLKQHRVPATFPPPQASSQFRGERKKKKRSPKRTKKKSNN